MELIALPDPSASGPTATSKLLVGPEPVFLRWGEWEKSFGPYWVVAVGGWGVGCGVWPKACFEPLLHCLNPCQPRCRTQLMRCGVWGVGCVM